MKRFCSLRTLAAGVAVLGLVSFAAPGERTVHAATQKVSVGILYLSADAGMFVAQERGYFAEQGLEVAFTRFTSGGDQIPLLATNRLNVGSGSSTPGLFNAYVRGLDVPIVSSKAIVSPGGEESAGLLIRRDLFESGEITKAEDLKGRRIAVNNIQSPSLNYTVRVAGLGGLGKDDLVLAEMPFPQFIPALQKQAVDAVTAYSPLAETLVRMNLARTMPGGSTIDIAGGDTANMMFYSAEFAKTDAATKFMLAHMKGLRAYHDAVFKGRGDRNEICGMIHKHVSFVPHDCSGMAMSAVDPNGFVNVESLERYQDEWMNWGLMRERADIRANVNMTFVNRAIEQLGKYEE